MATQAGIPAAAGGVVVPPPPPAPAGQNWKSWALLAAMFAIAFSPDYMVSTSVTQTAGVRQGRLILAFCVVRQALP